MSEQETNGASANASEITWPRYWRVLRWVLVFLSLVGALGTAVCLFRVGELSVVAWSHATAQPVNPPKLQQTTTPPPQDQPPAPPPSKASDNRDFSADFRSSENDHDNLLNRLIALVGLYTLFIGFFTLIAGLFSYINVEALKKRTEAQSADLDKDFAALKEKAAKLEGEIRDQLPELARLKQRLGEVVLDLDHLIPNEEDWAGGARISGPQRQEILISETTIAGLRIFLNPTAIEMRQAMSRLYRKLGRFYFDEFVRLNSVEASERADLYLGRAIELDPAAADSYQLRGSIALTRATQPGLNPSDGWSDAQDEGDVLGQSRQSIMDHAIRNLKRALQLNPDSLGAAYNLALSYYYSHRIELAIGVSTDARLKVKQALESAPPTLSSGEVRKYVPYLYTNIACYLFIQSQKESAAKQDWPDEALDILREGVGLLSRPGYREALNELRNTIANEIRRGDLSEVDAGFRRQVNEIFAEAEGTPPAGKNPGAPSA